MRSLPDGLMGEYSISKYNTVPEFKGNSFRSSGIEPDTRYLNSDSLKDFFVNGLVPLSRFASFLRLTDLSHGEESKGWRASKSLK